MAVATAAMGLATATVEVAEVAKATRVEAASSAMEEAVARSGKSR